MGRPLLGRKLLVVLDSIVNAMECNVEKVRARSRPMCRRTPAESANPHNSVEQHSEALIVIASAAPVFTGKIDLRMDNAHVTSECVIA